jgi:hypothetical protein
MKNQGFTLAQFAGAILLTITALLFIIIPLLKQPDPVTPPVIANTQNEVEEATLLNAADTLMMECPDLVKYGVDVKEIRMELGAASLTAQREKQWLTAAKATAIVNNKVTIAPQRAAGHHCQFEIGLSPLGEYGYFWAKRACAELCGVSANGKSYGYQLIMHSLASEAAAR